MEIILIALAAFAGGMATALIGFLQQGGPWDWKKFASSAIRSLIGGVVVAAAVDFSGAVSPIIYALAFLSGAGVEVGGNRIAGAYAANKE